jgi:hypothetical protein
VLGAVFIATLKGYAGYLSKRLGTGARPGDGLCQTHSAVQVAGLGGDAGHLSERQGLSARVGDGAGLGLGIGG